MGGTLEPISAERTQGTIPEPPGSAMMPVSHRSTLTSLRRQQIAPGNVVGLFMFTSQRNRAAVETADLRENRKARMDRHLWEITAVRDVFLLAVIVALIWFVVELRSVFLPVFIAIVFAYLVNPFVRLAETRFAAPRPLT